MPTPYADTPTNPWGIKIPAAAHGAHQLPIPQPATMGEVRTEAFHAKLKAAVTAQIEANASARAATNARADAQPYRPPQTHRPGAMLGAALDRTASPRLAGASPASPPAASSDPYAAGAETARALLGHGDPTPASGAAPTVPVASHHASEHEAGAEAARALLGHGGPMPASRAAPTAPAASHHASDYEAGAAEARRLIGL